MTGTFDNTRQIIQNSDSGRLLECHFGQTSRSDKNLRTGAFLCRL